MLEICAPRHVTRCWCELPRRSSLAANMRRKNETGQALYLSALALVVLMGIAGLGVDMGVLRYEKRLQQTSADAAAIAGADDIRYMGGLGVSGAATKASAANGFTNGVNATVTVNRGPQTGPHRGNANYVEVYVDAVQPTYFMKIFGINSEPIRARAVATLIGENGNSPCIYTLGPPNAGMTASGTPIVQASTCGVEVNGDFTTKNMNISAANIGVVGRAEYNGKVSCGGSTANCPVIGIPPTGDPLSFLAPPNVGIPVPFDGNPAPGMTYQSISIKGRTVNFPPGTYVVDGDFTIDRNAGGNATVTGTGVTFYITNGGKVTIDDTSTIQLSAPNSGTYAGILFYQDPNDDSKARLNGNEYSYYQGALYFPAAELTFGGNKLTNATAAYTIIVAHDLNFGGVGEVNIKSDYSSLPGGVSVIENAILVE